MSKKIWIMNHYATNTFFDKGGRHYCFAKYLIRDGYDIKIICASTVHNSEINVDTKGELFINDKVDGIPYTFIKTDRYVGNGKSRIKNMLQYYRRSFKVLRQLAKEEGKPDVILASSVHPFTLVAGIKIAKKWNIPCICEIRDLWPESLVTYGVISRNSPVTKALYILEKWAYKNADKLIFTIAGAANYIKDRHWEHAIDTSKIYNITNGIDMEQFDFNKNTLVYEDKELDREDICKVLYAGSIRKANNVKQIVDVAEMMQEKKIDDVHFIIFGDGDERKNLEKICKDNNINNICFRGYVDKKYIPSIVCRSSINIIDAQNSAQGLMQYGASPNKRFEYLAGGSPIMCSLSEGKYDIIEKNKVGIARNLLTTEEYCNAIIDIKERNILIKSNEEIKEFARSYSYEKLTRELESVLDLK